MIDVKIKVCGITNMEDAQAAIDMGADILGFNFYARSPRYIEPAAAMEIIRKLPAFVDTSGVFVNVPLRDIHHMTNSGMFNWVQFHGDETPDFCRQFRHWNIRTVKAVRVQSEDSIRRALEYPTYALLLDAYDSTLYGGTGKTFDWSLIKHFPRRVFIAGGITPENVSKALESGAYGIDICSGIESRPGKKDHKKMKRLFDTIFDYTGQKVRQRT
ncbi:MAG: phosphoribosylanthranilate isomerase [Planctomycetaceae bacterium]|nr:phosphoribosylanthranilate isomerase [Planctomycetaceae bacterium]